MSIEINIRAEVHLHDGGQGKADQRQAELVKLINDTKDTIMASLDDIVAGESSENSALAILATGLQTLLDGQAALQSQLADLLSGVVVPPAVQAKIDAAFAAQTDNFASIQADIAKLPVPPATASKK